jgi:polyphosphate glucokinase
MTIAIGVDVGGTGIKAAVVDTASGALLSARERLPTPRPGTPESVREAIGEVIARLDVDAPVGIALPAVIQHGVVHRATNLDASWLGSNVGEIFAGPDLGSRGPVTFLNDADAAGLAEASFGAARNVRGLAVMITLGTGIGSALLVDGRLAPNAELGHLELDGEIAERDASARARERLGLDWPQWAARVSHYLQHVEGLLWPEVFVIGGGVSKKPEPWFGLLKTHTELRLAELVNNAGIVGAAAATPH